jgi:hypothetical protein
MRVAARRVDDDKVGAQHCRLQRRLEARLLVRRIARGGDGGVTRSRQVEALAPGVGGSILDVARQRALAASRSIVATRPPSCISDTAMCIAVVDLPEPPLLVADHQHVRAARLARALRLDDARVDGRVEGVGHSVASAQCH